MESRNWRHPTIPSLILALGVAALTACAGDPGESAADGHSEAGTEDVASEAPAPPDTTAASLWSYLNEVEYEDNWSLWPDKGELYQGAEPHGMLLTTYLNDRAHGALTSSAGTLPNHSIVVKENYTPDSTLAAITVMYKQRGYDAEHNDWFWVKYLPDGSVDADGEASGRVPGCIDCHGGASGNDFVMTESLAGGGS